MINIKLITREKLEHVAKKILKYPLHDAEKDYFLAIVMWLVSQSSLSKKLVFKGGTAIHHCYLNQLRFSEDLDFTAHDKEIKIRDLKTIFKNIDLLEVVKDYQTKYTLKIERLKYYGVLDTPNSIKLEVDRFQNIVLPPVTKTYNNVWGIDFKVNVMSPMEICVEKIRACNDRFRYRDFYDLYLLANRLGINSEEIIKLIPQKEIRKPLSKVNILRNLDLALNDKSGELDTIIYQQKINKDELQSFFQQLEVGLHQPNV